MRVSASSMKYANTLAEVAFEQGNPDEVLAALKEFAEVYSAHSTLEESLSSPALPLQVKQKIVDSIAARLKLLKIVRNFLMVLLERSRQEQLDEIVVAFQRVLDERNGMVRVDVRSAKPLSSLLKQRLESTMKEVTRRKVRLSYETDESLIGGVRLQVGSTVFDGTLKTELEQIKRQLAV